MLNTASEILMLKLNVCFRSPPGVFYCPLRAFFLSRIHVNQVVRAYAQTLTYLYNIFFSDFPSIAQLVTKILGPYPSISAKTYCINPNLFRAFRNFSDTDIWSPPCWIANNEYSLCRHGIFIEFGCRHLLNENFDIYPECYDWLC